MTLLADSKRCTCGGEDSDGRMDVLRCPVHGIGPEPWDESEPEIAFTVCGDVPWDEMSPETQGAICAVARAAYDHLGKLSEDSSLMPCNDSEPRRIHWPTPEKAPDALVAWRGGIQSDLPRWERAYVAVDVLQAQLAEMELHDDLPDSFDLGYMQAWREFRDWLARMPASPGERP